MKNIIVIVLVFLSYNLLAQKSTSLLPSQRSELFSIEQKMKFVGSKMLYDTTQEERLSAARNYVKLLKDALKIENSYQYSFDSIPFMAKVNAEDSSFRILTFQVILNGYTYRHYGCIQFNRKSIKLIPLMDFSDTFPITPQYTLSNKNWLGAVYYKMLSKKIDKKTVYFLYGYDQNDVLTDKKYIEAMWLEGDTIARFGMPVFEKTEKILDPNSLKEVFKTKLFYRYVLEYRKGGTLSIKYEKEKDMIVHDHIDPKDPKAKEYGYMKMPDGTYEGLKWYKNKWVWQNYVPIGENETNAPTRPAPLKDKKEVRRY